MDFSILRRQQRVKLRIYPGPLVELVKKKVGCGAVSFDLGCHDWNLQKQISWRRFKVSSGQA